MITRSPFIGTSWIALAFLFALTPSTAMGNCQTQGVAAWELLQPFNAVQDNGFNVVFELDEFDQRGQFTGVAHYYTGSDFHRVEGRANAHLDGMNLELSVSWPNKSVGGYTGHIDSSGGLLGVTKDLQDPT